MCLMSPLCVNRFWISPYSSSEKNPTPKQRTEWVYALVDIVFTGTDTTVSILIWSIAALAQNPHVTTKAYEEIDRVLGKRPPTHEDMKSMPYVRAAFYESCRYRPVTALGIPRVVTSADGELQLGGYDIPHGTVVFLNYWSLFKDPRFWENAGECIPERFLTEDDFFTDTHLLPFGSGPRNCVGTNLAEPEIFLVITSLLQNFEFELPQDYKYEPELRLTLRPKGNTLPIKVSRRIH